MKISALTNSVFTLLLIIFLGTAAMLRAGETGVDPLAWMPPTGNRPIPSHDEVIVPINIEGDKIGIKLSEDVPGLIMIANVNTHDVAYMFSCRAIHQITVDNRLKTTVVYFKTGSIYYVVGIPEATMPNRELMLLFSRSAALSRR